MKIIVGLTVCFLAAAQTLAEADPATAENPGASSTTQVGEREVTIKALKVAPGVYAITGAGGNMGLVVGDDGAFLIDDQYAHLTEGIRQVIAQLTDNSFIGEMSFVSGKPASATVTATGRVRLLEWPRARLSALLDRSPEIRIAFQSILGVDMAAKLSAEPQGEPGTR